MAVYINSKLTNIESANTKKLVHFKRVPLNFYSSFELYECNGAWRCCNYLQSCSTMPQRKPFQIVTPSQTPQ